MKLTLKNVRLSFPALWKAKSINGGEAKFGASFLIDKEKDAAQLDAVKNAMKEVAREQWPNGIPKGVKFALRDGSEKDFDGYGDGVMFISSSSSHRVPVVAPDRTPLAEEDGKPYAGCYVNASIRLWAQDNNFGKRVNAQLCGVQFVRDGESFGDKPFNPEEEFEDLSKSSTSTGNGAVGAPEDDDIPFLPNYL